MDLAQSIENLNRHLIEMARQVDVVAKCADAEACRLALEGLERAVAGLLRVVREEFGSDGTADSITEAVAADLATRSLVATCDLIDLLSASMKVNWDVHWGSHLIADAEFGKRRLQRIPADRLCEPAINGLALGVTSFFYATAEDIRLRLSTPPTSIEQVMSSICAKLGGTWVHAPTGPRDVELVPVDEVIRTLGLADVAEVDELVLQRQILCVREWSGEAGFPAFQFDRDQIHTTVSAVLAGSDLPVDTWSTALYLSDAIESRELSVDQIQAELGSAGRWEGPSSNHSQVHTGTPETVAAGNGLFRICKEEHSPTYFSTHGQPGTGGRFDLPSSGDRGALYLAQSVRGACTEVFSREPRLSLGDLLSRRLWEVRPTEDLTVVDLRGEGSELNATTDRSRTQAIARDVAAMQGRRGIMSMLRSTADGVGVTLFGPKGVTPPAAADLGVWEFDRLELFNDNEFLDFVERERGVPSRFPIIALSRLPSDLVLVGA